MKLGTYSRAQYELVLVCMTNISNASESIHQGDDVSLVDGPDGGQHLRYFGQELRLHALLNDVRSAGRLAF